MERGSVEAIVRTLNESGTRYLIAGGLAVVAHGHVRFTADVDLIVELTEENARRAVAALASLGYRPRAPVEFSGFADPLERARWIRERGLVVFSVFSLQHPATEVDLFAEVPMDFERAYRECRRMEVAPGLEAPFVGLRDLLEMKRRAGRPQDLDDVERLEALGRPRETE